MSEVRELLSPKGTRITSVLQKLIGSATLTGARSQEDGLFDLEYGGYTEIFYDSSEDLLVELERVFCDESLQEFRESELVLGEVIGDGV